MQGYSQQPAEQHYRTPVPLTLLHFEGIHITGLGASELKNCYRRHDGCCHSASSFGQSNMFMFSFV